MTEIAQQMYLLSLLIFAFSYVIEINDLYHGKQCVIVTEKSLTLLEKLHYILTWESVAIFPNKVWLFDPFSISVSMSTFNSIITKVCVICYLSHCNNST